MVLNPSVSVRFSVKMREIGFASIISLTGLRVGDGGVRLRTIGEGLHGHWIGQSNRGSFITDYEWVWWWSTPNGSCFYLIYLVPDL